MGQNSGVTHQDCLAVDELSILNHELGNVLNGLNGMAGLLRDSGLSAEQGRWLEAIERSGRQMCRIMESTLACRNGDKTGIGARLQKMNGIDLLEDVMIAHAPAALSKGLAFVLVPDGTLPARWNSDCGLLRQLLDNLVVNAIKFTGSGHVMLRAGLAQNGHLDLSVCDSGPGVAEPDLVFDPWQRGSAEGSGLPGCGLGLFICRRIAEGLGGSLAVSREPAGGARFTARIPIEPGFRQAEAAGIRSLAGLVCRLDLEQPMLESVQGLLGRLDVRWKCKGSREPGGSGPGDEIQVEQGKGDSASTGLKLYHSNPGPGMSEVYLAAPVLESGLEKALFQLVLQRQFEGLQPAIPGRSVNPGSNTG